MQVGQRISSVLILAFLFSIDISGLVGEHGIGLAQAADAAWARLVSVADSAAISASGIAEGKLRFGADSTWDFTADYEPVPVPRRNTGANDEVVPLGRMVTHDVRTGQTSYTVTDRAKFLAEAGLFQPGTPHKEEDGWAKNFSAYQVVTDPTLPEYRDKVKLYMMWINSSGDTLNFVGSGTLIGPTTVITAGHCVFNDVRAGSLGTNALWAHDVRVVPAFGSQTAPYGSAHSVQFHSWEGWTGSRDYDHDIAVIDLDRPVGALTGWEGYGVGGECSFFTGGAWVHSDYPSEDGYDGQDMYTETGHYDGCETFGNEVWYDRPGHGGSSGGGAIKDGGNGTGVWAIRSNTSYSLGTGYDSWDTRLTSAKFSDIGDFIAEDRPPSVDFIPLDVALAQNVATIGGSFPPTSFRLFNASAAIYQDVVSFDLYLSADDNISGTDTRLASYEVDLHAVAANFTAELVELAVPSVPGNLSPGNYFVGVIITTPDWNPSNNDTDGWDAAPLALVCEPASMTSLISPANNSTCLDTSLTLNWNYVDSAIGYRLVLFRSAKPPLIYHASTSSFTVPDLEPGLDYWWQVATVGACGDTTNYTPGWKFTTTGDVPATPVPVAPADADSCLPATSLLLDWSDVAGATGYELRVGTSCGAGSFYSSAVSNQTITNLSAGTTYYWTVRAVDACSQASEWTACRSFYTGPTLTGISGLRTPFLNQSEISVPALLNWEDTPEATSYQVRIGLDPLSMQIMTTDISELSVADLVFNQTYYWSVRPVSDCGQAGIWAPTWAFQTIGPGPNLTYASTLGWVAPVVPRSASDATIFVVPAPTALYGDSLVTRWNMDGLNNGDVGSGAFHNHLLVDGQYTSDGIMLSSSAGQRFSFVNRGPVMVRGGKHTFGGQVDATNNIVEQHEGDNGSAKQWTWTPAMLPPSSSRVRQAPPALTGGHESIPDTDLLYWNCDGVRFRTTGWWNAVTIHAPNPADDYDIGLYTPSTGPTTGFDYLRAVSMRPPGCTDAVLVNRNISEQIEDWDIGITRQLGTGDYRIVHTVSTSFAFGTSAVVPLAQDEMLALKEVLVTAGNTGWISVLVDVDPADGPVSVNWLDRTFEKGGLLDFTATGVTDSTGHLALSLNVPNSGYYGLAVYRDAADGTGPVAVTLQIGPAVPDLAISTPANWHAPVVPRVENVPYPWDVLAAPAYLLGDTVGTHYYANIHNDSPVDIPAYRLSIQLDGSLDILYDLTALPAFGSRQFHGGSQLWAKAGLHTLALVLDPQATLAESRETNNVHGEQWGWIPVAHAVDVPGTRGTPPDKQGGWATIPAGATKWPNADGIRTPVFSPLISRRWLVGTAIMPLSSDADYDLTLHPRSDDAVTAFRSRHVTSGWTGSQSDFAVVSLRNAAEYQWDVGVTKTAGSGNYLYHSTECVDLGSDPMGDQGSSRIRPGEILDLYEAYFNPGIYLATVRNDSGTVDWGFSIIDQAIDYAGKSDTYQDGVSPGIAWESGPGMDESIAFEITTAGHYGLAVWKVGSTDAYKGGRYTLRLVNQVSGVGANEGTIPAASGIASVWPNPFNPATTISFDMATTDNVDVSIFDLQGRLVKSLFSGEGMVGSHQVVWNGLDQRGRPVTSGVYFVHLRTGPTIRTQKIALVR